MLEQQLDAYRLKAQKYNLQGNTTNFRRQRALRLHADLVDELGNLLATRLLLDEFERLELRRIDPWKAVKDLASWRAKKDWKYYWDTWTKWEAEAKAKAVEKLKKTKLLARSQTERAKDASGAEEMSSPPQKTKSESQKTTIQTQKAGAGSKMLPTGMKPIEIGHWEFTRDDDECIARILLRGTDYVNHDRDITADDVHKFQHANPGPNTNTLTRIVDQPDKEEVGEEE